MSFENYYQNEAVIFSEFENAMQTEIIEHEQHLQEMKDEANYWAKVDRADFERENETYNWDLN